MSSSSQPVPPGTTNEEDDNGGDRTGAGVDSRSELEVSLAMREVIRSGRGIRRLVTLCGTIRQLVKENDQRLLDLPDTDPESDDEAPQPPRDPQELAQTRDRDWHSFQALVKLVPGLRQRIGEPSEMSRVLYYKHLVAGANSARSDDISRVKPKIAEWLNSRPGVSTDQHLSLSKRDGRGLQHEMTGKLLCPIKYDWDDLSIRTKIRDEVDGYSASADYWLRCLYEDEQGNPGDVEKGFLKSELLVKTFKVIFTSPSSAEGDLNEPDNHIRRGKPTGAGPPKRANNAEKHGMDGSVTPRAIAYAAAQLHFNLTDATHWMNHYNGFSYEEFYEFVIDFFEADTTPGAQEASAKLLEWWNKAVFPRSAATRAAAPTSTRKASLAVLRQQRQAARASNPPP